MKQDTRGKWWKPAFRGASLLMVPLIFFSLIFFSLIMLPLIMVPPLFGQQAAAPPAAPVRQKYSELPDGPGKDTLIRVCGKCHSPDNVIANGQDRAGWESTITKMASYGAVGSDDEYTEILDYLTKNFPGDAGPIHVNQATAAQLKSGLGLTAAEADAVIAYKKANGDFKSVDDLKKVPDVDAKKLDAKKERLAF